jgi:hypothetical protein
MLDPVSDIEYRTADDQALSPNELEQLIETEECAVELYRGTEPILSIAEPRRFEARGVDARVRHPSVGPSDAFIEVTATITLSLARDRCQPFGATPPPKPVSTAKRDIIEAIHDTDADAAAEDGAEDGSDTPETWESSSVTTRVSSDAEEVETVASDRGGGGEPSPSADTPAEAGELADGDSDPDDEDDGDTKIVLRDGEFVEVPADDDGE